MRLLKIGVFVLIAIVVLKGAPVNDQWTIEGRRFFKSLDELKSAFEKHKVPILVQEMAVSGNKYVFVTAAPYSGVNSVDLYCYQYTGANWSLYTSTFLT